MSIRREISASGRSKVYVNDTSVTLQTLALIVPRLIDIHSQHANAKINDPSERLRIIDSMAANDELRGEYRMLFDEYVDLRRRIKSRREALARTAENIEFLRFQLDQLDKLAPKAGELREIERRFEMLSDADDIKEKLQMLSAMLGDSNMGLQTVLNEATVLADKLDFNAMDGEASGSSLPIPARLRNLLVEAKDIYETIDDLNSRIDTDPMTLAKLSERMNLYYEAVKRFRVKDADDLATLHADIRRQVNEITLGDDEIPEMEREARRIGHELKAKADELSESRRATASEFSELLCRTARPLGLANINFRAELVTRKLTATGQDEVEFLCSFNKNGTPRPIGDIASGGEIAHDAQSEIDISRTYQPSNHHFRRS